MRARRSNAMGISGLFKGAAKVSLVVVSLCGGIDEWMVEG